MDLGLPASHQSVGRVQQERDWDELLPKPDVLPAQQPCLRCSYYPMFLYPYCACWTKQVAEESFLWFSSEAVVWLAA